MEIEDYKSNSDASRREAQEEKKVEPVVSSPGKIRKKGGALKVVSGFVEENLGSVLSYIWTDVLKPNIKKAISEMVNTGTDMLLYGESKPSNKRSITQKVSWRDYYDREPERVNSRYLRPQTAVPSYDDILYDTRGDAEAVLASLRDMIARYGLATILDLYDAAQVPTDNYTLKRYGWDNLDSGYAHRVRDGYILVLPKAKPL